MIERIRNPRQADFIIWIVLIIATIAIATFVVSKAGSRVGPPYQVITSGPTATPAPTATPGAGGSEGLNAWLRNEPRDPSSSQDIAFWHVSACISDCNRETTVGFTPGANDLITHPIFIGSDGTFGNLALAVDTAVAATTVRVGIYDADFNTASMRVYPGNLVEDYGSISTATTGFKEITCTVCATITPGLYFLVAVVDSSSVVFERLDDAGLWAVPYGTFSSGTQVCPGLEVDNYTASHTALPSVYPTPGPAIQCAALDHALWLAVELN